MSGVLQSLLNPLEMKDSLPSTMAMRRNFAAGDVIDQTYWNADVQYFLNDVVFSTVNDGAYVMIGGPDAPAATSVRGAAFEPTTTPDWWAPLTQFGAQTAGGALLPITIGTNTGSVLVLSGTGQTRTGLTGGTTYLVTIQGTATGSATMVASEWLRFTVTGSAGTGSVSQSVTVLPNTVAATTPFSVSCVVRTGATISPTATIAITCAVDATVPATITPSSCFATYMPLA